MLVYQRVLILPNYNSNGKSTMATSEIFPDTLIARPRGIILLPRCSDVSWQSWTQKTIAISTMKYQAILTICHLSLSLSPTICHSDINCSWLDVTRILNQLWSQKGLSRPSMGWSAIFPSKLTLAGVDVLCFWCVLRMVPNIASISTQLRMFDAFTPGSIMTSHYIVLHCLKKCSSGMVTPLVTIIPVTWPRARYI